VDCGTLPNYINLFLGHEHEHERKYQGKSVLQPPIPVQSYVKSPIKKKLFHEAWLLVYKTRKETT
jgi:hypothetical protein